MKKLQQRTKFGFKPLSRKRASYIKGGCGNSNGPCPPPYEPGGGGGDKKDKLKDIIIHSESSMPPPPGGN